MIYASFQQAPLSPFAVLTHALEQSLENAGFSYPVRSAAVAFAPCLKLSAPFGSFPTSILMVQFPKARLACIICMHLDVG